ncbi:MAG: cytochrome ubiquinol oxidase subunit I [Ignavibacteriae bacterium]|nr:cytochrome ubiquinol oxidase subunit I [Ignavibacteriota bacterium]MCB9243302.1 cytochrome ubiquinol oxidase subunit I [Ignavibacteriales bacterium]
MEDLLAARLQMAVSLGFHIIFACIGMSMPFLMAVAEWKYNRTGDKVYLDLTKAWSKGVAIFFATGAVSGTVLSFELGLLWPKFMDHAGPIIGMPFSLEGTAFFLEAIALGLYLYGWNRVNKWAHWVFGLIIGVSGVASGIFVVSANSWMNSPTGFDWVDGKAINVDPVAAMFNPAWLSQAHHMILAAFVATAFAVAGIHAFLLIRNPGHELHKRALKIAMMFAAVFALLQPISGDLSAKFVARNQPLKLAAMEGLFKTTTHAPLTIGGIPDMKEKKMNFGIEIPGGLSFLAFEDFNAEVKGLDAFPEDEWPPVPIVHISFQIMVGIGSILALIGVLYLYFLFRKKNQMFNKWYLKLLFLCTPLGFIAVEAGWFVTEVGRQPWIIYGIMKTKDSLTSMPGLTYTLILYTVLYLILSFIVAWLMYRQIKALHIKYSADA